MHLAHWSAGTESKRHPSVTPSPTNHDPLCNAVAHWQGLYSGVSGGAEAAQETGGGGASAGVINVLAGPAELSGFCLIYVRDCLYAGSEGCRGSRGEKCGEGYHYETAAMLLAL